MGHKFEKFCKSPENIENYEKAKADNFKGWDCHHRLETHNSDGKRCQKSIVEKTLKVIKENQAQIKENIYLQK